MVASRRAKPACSCCGRALTPRGVAIDLGSPASDTLGRSGVSGGVDTLFWSRFGAALMLSVLEDARTSPGEQSHRKEPIRLKSPDKWAIRFCRIEKHQTNPEKEPGDTAAIFVAKDFDFGSVYNLALRR
jgi:type IV secretion system protein VirB10